MTEISPNDAADKVEVRLRYRPSGDVLIGEARFEVVDELIDDLDSDTSITWARRPGSGTTYFLSSFSIIGAQRRFRNDRPDFVPPSIWEPAESMFRSVSPGPVGSAARIEARAEARLVVAFDALRRIEESPRSSESDIATARSLASSLRDLGSSMRLVLDAFDSTDPDVGTPARRFLDGVDSLASLVVAHRRSTPSALTDLLDNLRGGLPLSDTERQRLRLTLERANDPDQWKTAAHELNQLAAAVRGEHRLDTPEGT